MKLEFCEKVWQKVVDVLIISAQFLAHLPIPIGIPLRSKLSDPFAKKIGQKVVDVLIISAQFLAHLPISPIGILCKWGLMVNVERCSGVTGGY